MKMKSAQNFRVAKEGWRGRIYRLRSQYYFRNDILLKKKKFVNVVGGQHRQGNSCREEKKRTLKIHCAEKKPDTVTES